MLLLQTGEAISSLERLLPEIAIAVIFAGFMLAFFRYSQNVLTQLLDQGKSERAEILDRNKAERDVRDMRFIESLAVITSELERFFREERDARREHTKSLMSEIRQMQATLIKHDERTRPAVEGIASISDELIRILRERNGEEKKQ